MRQILVLKMSQGPSLEKRMLMDIPEAFETQRLKFIVPYAGAGANLLEAMLDGYEEGMRWLGWNKTKPSQQEIEVECRNQRAEFILRQSAYYILFCKETNKIVGRCAFPSHWMLWNIPQFGIAYFVRKSERGKGYAAEASYALASLAFDKMGAKKVEIRCEASNSASNSVPPKIGFTLECSYRGGWVQEDKKLAAVNVYSVFSKDQLKAL